MIAFRWFRRKLTDDERRMPGEPDYSLSTRTHAEPVLQVRVVSKTAITWEDVPIVLEGRQ